MSLFQMVVFAQKYLAGTEFDTMEDKEREEKEIVTGGLFNFSIAFLGT